MIDSQARRDIQDLREATLTLIRTSEKIKERLEAVERELISLVEPCR